MKKRILIVILILALLATSSYIIYDKVFYEEKNPKSTENKTTEKVKDSKENLDVNSRLVQTLYNKVVDKDGPSKYWMYNTYLNPDSTDRFIVSEVAENEKMDFVGYNLNENKKEIVECNSSIPDTVKINNIDYKSACYATKVWQYTKIQYAYNKDYVETIYKELFGNDVKLDTSVDIPNGVYAAEVYHYIASLDKYVLYMTETGGTSVTNYSGVVTNAVKSGNEIKITEKVTHTDPEKTEEYTYVYTFKLEDDGMYSFVSRIKES